MNIGLINDGEVGVDRSVLRFTKLVTSIS